MLRYIYIYISGISGKKKDDIDKETAVNMGSIRRKKSADGKGSLLFCFLGVDIKTAEVLAQLELLHKNTVNGRTSSFTLFFIEK